MKYFLIFIFAFSTIVCTAQTHSIRGRIVDADTKDPVAYADIAVLSETDSLLSGVLSDHKGIFNIAGLPDNARKIVISFMGYEAVTLDDIFSESGVKNAGDIYLKVSAHNINQVVVSGSRSSFAYKADRKVINAENFPASDYAIDLLSNIPSVQLNFEGKLTYRGEGTFKVYINGNVVPNGEEKLKTIPVSQIDRIEIITNPSAKYDAQGTAGIIQVILKKNRMEGYMISATLASNTRGEYYGLFSVDRKYKNYGWFVQGQWCEYVWSKYKEIQNRSVTNAGKHYETFMETQNENRERKSYIEAGFNYDITPKDYISFSGNVNPFKIKQFNTGNGYADERITYLNGEAGSNSAYDMQSRLDYKYQYWGTTLNYKHRFNKERTHLLSLNLDLSGYVSDLTDQLTDIKVYRDHTDRTGYIAGEKNEFIVLGKLDYKVPLSSNFKLETGFHINMDNIPQSHSASGTYDNNGMLVPFENEPSKQLVSFHQNIYAGYVTASAQLGKLEALLGLRVEHTQRSSEYSFDDKSERIVIPAKNNFTDFFPTAHASFNISEESQIYASYSRRIGRPDYWSLIPLKQYKSLYSYYQGNANLKPSLSNAFEIGYKNSWDKDFIAAEIFVRTTNHVIQNYSRTETDNVLFYTPENVGRSTNIGVDLMGGVDIFKIWNLNCSAAIYTSRLNVDFGERSEIIRKFRIDGRINNTIKLPLDFTLRCDVNYRSPMVNAQQTREGYFFSNISLRKGFFKNQLGIIVSGNNIFNTVKYSTVEKDADFYINTRYSEKPYVSFRLIYTFNNQK